MHQAKVAVEELLGHGGVAGAVGLAMGRPVLFRQHRPGQHGRLFTLYKFRTMVEGAEERQEELLHLNEMDGPVFKLSKDPRVTRFGRFLRRFSLDELPQLWNVLRGDMSLVGPRPLLMQYLDRYTPEQARRHEVKPGLTGLWQVTARGDAPMHEATDIDVDYVENITFVDDAKILLLTPAAVLGSRKGS